MISILLATYNGEKYIKECIDSVINQTYKDWELLIGFNGTTDNSKDIVSSYDDKRIKVFDYGDDKGKSKTLNKLLKKCKYDWCAMQDDDDIWLKDKLENQVLYLNEDYDVIGTRINYLIEDKITKGPKLSLSDKEIKRRSFLGDNQVANSSSIFRKSDALDLGGWNEKVEGIEDFDFWLKLMRKNKVFINIPKYLVLHRMHPESNFNTKTHDLSKIL